MRCDAFEDRLQHLLDERQCPEDDALLAEHAADCPHCRDVLDAQAGLFDTVRDWSVANLEVDLVDRVVDRVVSRATVGTASVRVAASRSWWQTASGRWTALAVAAALVLVAWKGIDRFAPRTANDSSPSAVDPGHTAQNVREPRQRTPNAPLEFGPLARKAAEDLGSRLALGVHYLHRGRTAVTDALRGQLSRKPDAAPGERSSSLLFNAASRLTIG